MMAVQNAVGLGSGKIRGEGVILPSLDLLLSDPRGEEASCAPHFSNSLGLSFGGDRATFLGFPLCVGTLFVFVVGQKAEQMQSIMMKNTVKRPAAHAQELVVHLSGWSTKTAINGSKKFSSKLLNKPSELSKNPPSGIKESEHPGDVSSGSKHSHLG